MKKLKNVFISIAFVCFCISTSANTTLKGTETNDTIKKKIVYEPSLFTENLYFEAAAGTQILFSKDADRLNFTDRFTPVLSIAIGKWFSPSWGLRIQAQGYALNGFSTVNGIYLADPQLVTIYGNNDPVRNFVIIYPDGSYRYFLRYVNAKIDFQTSILNLLTEYNISRRFDLIAAIGLGYMHVFDYKGVPHTNTISANFELMSTYNLSERLSLNLKVQTAMMPDHFDGRIAGNKYENYSSVSIGLSYFLKKKGFTKAECPENSLPLNTVLQIDTVYKMVNQIDTVYQIINRIDTVFKEIGSNPIENKNQLISSMDLPKKYAQERYLVKEGERFYSIARHYYKDPYLWPLIYYANKSIVPDPEFVPAGIEILLPSVEGSAERLTNTDKKSLARAYIEVYLYYKDLDKSNALNYLWFGTKLNKGVLDEYTNQIDSNDLKMLNSLKNN